MISKLDVDIEAIRPAVNALMGVVTSYSQEAKWFIEAQVSLPQVPGAFGTSDIVVYDPPILHVIDYKFGQKPIRPENNFGLMFYAAASILGPELALDRLPDDVLTPRLTIIQPSKS